MTIRSKVSLGRNALCQASGLLLQGLLAILLLLISIGCRRDKELTKMQAEVNRAATELVIQDAEARRQWMEIQQRVDEDRRQLAKEQRRDPIIAQAILQIGGIGLCLLPLWLVARLLQRSEIDPVFHPIDDMVFDELIGHSVPLLSAKALGTDSPHDSPGNQPQPTDLTATPCDLNAWIDDRLQRHRD